MSQKETNTESSTKIFQDRDPFKHDFDPDTIIGREDKIDELAAVFQDIVDGFQPPDVLVYGDPGTGKRTVTGHMLELVRNDAEINVIITTVDCVEHNTTYQIYLSLANKLSEERYSHGTSWAELEEAIFEHSEHTDTVHLFVLENVESLSRDDQPFEKLRKDRAVSDNKYGIVGISNKNNSYEHLLAEVPYSSEIDLVEFTPYTSAELRAILESRAEIAFTEGVLTHGAVSLCAAKVCQETGNARKALKLLELSGFIAQQSGNTQVTEDHVREALRVFTQFEVLQTFRQDLTVEEQLVLALITARTEVDETQLELEEIYHDYQKTRSLFNLNDVGKRRFREFIHQLENEHLVVSEEHNAGSQGGIWLTYELAVSPRPIVEAAIITSGTFELLFRKLDVSTNKIRNAEGGVDFEAFVKSQ